MRLQLVQACRAAIYAALCRAVGNGQPINDAVVVVADSSDPLGRAITKAAVVHGASLDDQAFNADEFEQGPFTIIVVTVAAARRLLAPSHPSVAGGLDRQPTSSCVRVVAIADGTSLLVHADIRPSAPIAEG